RASAAMMQSVGARSSGPADSHRCSCCPFGYHIDSSFVSFARSVNAGSPSPSGANGAARPARRRARGGSVGAVPDRRKPPPPPPASGLRGPVGPSASTGGGSVQDLIDELTSLTSGSPMSPLSPSPAPRPDPKDQDTFATFGTTQRRLTVQPYQQLEASEEASAERQPPRQSRRPHSVSGRRENSTLSPPPRQPQEQQEDLLLQRLQRPAPTVQFATSGVSTSSLWEARAASCEAAVRTAPPSAETQAALKAFSDAATDAADGSSSGGVDFGQTVFASEDGSLDEPVSARAATPRPADEPRPATEARVPAAMAALPDMGWDEALLRRLEAEEAVLAAAGEAAEEPLMAAQAEKPTESGSGALAEVSFAFMLPPQKRDFSQQVCAADGKESAMEELVVDARAAGAAESSPAPRSAFQHRGFDRKMIELPIIEVPDDPRVQHLGEDEDYDGEAVEEPVECHTCPQAQSTPNFAWMLPGMATQTEPLRLPPAQRDFSQQVCVADGEESAMEELIVDARAAGPEESAPPSRRPERSRRDTKIELPVIEVPDDPRVDLIGDEDDLKGEAVEEPVERQAGPQAHSAPNFAWMLPGTATQTEPDNSVTRVVSFLSVAIGTEKPHEQAREALFADASIETDSVCLSDVSMETVPVAKSDFAFATSPVGHSNVAIETERQFFRDVAMETMALKYISTSMLTDAATFTSVAIATDDVGRSHVASETERVALSCIATETEAVEEPPVQQSTSSAASTAVEVVDAISECRPQLTTAAAQARPTCQDAAVDCAVAVMPTADASQQADCRSDEAPGVDQCVGTDAAPEQQDERSRRRSGAGRRHAGVTARPACRDVSLSFCAAPPERRSVGLDACDFDDRTTAALVDAAVSTLDAADDVDEASEAAEASLLGLTLVHRRQSVQTQIRQLRRSYGLGAGELAQLVGELLRRDVKSAASQARPDTASTSAATGSGLMVSRCVGGDNDDSSVARTKSAEAAVQCRPAAANKFAFTERLHNFEAATNTCRPQLRDQFTSPERSLLQHSVACGPAWPLTVTTDVAAIPDSPGTDSPPTPPTPPLEQSLPTLPEPAGRPAIHPQPGRPLPDTAGYARTQMPPGAGTDSPIHQFSVAEAAAAAGALASPGSPRSILKRNRPDPAEQRSRDSKKGVRFQPDVVGGSPSSSSADDDDLDDEDDDDDMVGSPIEGSYFGADGRIELLYERGEEAASASAFESEGSAAGVEAASQLSPSPAPLQVPQDVEKACSTYEAWRHDSTGVSAAELNDALSLIRRDWFRVSSVREASASQVKAYCDYFAAKSEHLLDKVVNMADDNGNTSLHYSVSHGRWSVVRVLLAAGRADADRSNLSGYSAAMLTGLSHLSDEDAEGRETLRDLLRRSDVNRKATSVGHTALMLSASHGRLAILRLLLEAGADPNAQDDEGSTALMFAAEHGNLECARELLARPQTSTELEDNEGSTALSIAMASGHRDVALLIYARVNLPNKGEKRSPSLSRKFDRLGQRPSSSLAPQRFSSTSGSENEAEN
ncbi:hypothetical protein BOX15_Mlig007877g3, partial [Macrostomum lignano]